MRGLLTRVAEFFLGIGLAFQAGCHFDPYLNECLTSAPPRSELVGEWVFYEASPGVPDGFGRGASFLLSSDGRCEFRNPCRVNGPWLWGNEESARGTWRISQYRDRYCCLQFALRTVGETPVDFTDCVLLRRVSGILTLHYTYGDPDDGKFVSFRNKAGDKKGTKETGGVKR
jgi:hypothetical protein